jgi:hypothetical protein
MIIIIVLKHNSRVNPGQDPSYKLGGSIRIDLGQCKDKSGYYHSFKTQLGGWTVLTRDKIKIKVVIIIVLKSDSGVNSE